MGDSAQWRAIAAALALAAVASCSTVDELFPSNGTVRLTLADGGLTPRSAEEPGIQITQWTVESATAEIDDFGLYEFLGRSPCEYNSPAVSDLVFACGGSRFALASAVAHTATVHLTISRMVVHREDRPDLPSAGDHDWDGVRNADDNCVLVRNEDQADGNEDGFGDACSIVDTLTELPTIPDRDLDGIADFGSPSAFPDNCLWIPNPDQTDAEGDRIGDACERSARVILPDGRLQLNSRDVAFTVSGGASTVLIVDFDTTQTISCTSSFDTCSWIAGEFIEPFPAEGRVTIRVLN